MTELATTLRARVEPLLEAGEELLGTCLATEQTLFSGHPTAVGVTQRRLLLQPLDRKFEPRGEPLLLRHEDVVAADAGGESVLSSGLSEALVDAATTTLKLRTTSGRKVKLMMMRGGSLLGRLGGGEEQQAGIRALADWFARAD